MLDTLHEPSEEALQSEVEDLENETPETDDDDATLNGEESELDDDELEEGEDEEGESITLDGEEITADEIRELKKGNLRQSDYTKKTTELARQREEATALNAQLSGAIELLESLIVEQENDSNLDELLEEGDTAEYLRQTNLLKAKKKKLEKAKKAQSDALASKQAEEGKLLLSVMDAWKDPKSGASTQKSDVDGALQYAADIGFTNDDLAKISDHKVMRALVDAGKLAKLKKSKPEVRKRKVNPTKKVSTKSKQTKSSEKDVVDLFYGSK